MKVSIIALKPDVNSSKQLLHYPFAKHTSPCYWLNSKFIPLLGSTLCFSSFLPWRDEVRLRSLVTRTSNSLNIQSLLCLCFTKHAYPRECSEEHLLRFKHEPIYTLSVVLTRTLVVVVQKLRSNVLLNLHDDMVVKSSVWNTTIWNLN
jgi:hypothetical protein